MTELRSTVRGLLQRPLFTAIAVLTLALGIGANTSIFSVFEGVLLRDLPYRDPDSLVSIGEQSDVPRARNIGFLTMVDWKSRTHAFDSMAVYRTLDMALSGDGAPEQIRVLQGSADFLTTLGVDPAQGRGWTSDEASTSGSRVVLISHGFWLRRFGGDPQIIGRPIVLNELQYEVIGILQPSFRAYFAEGEGSAISAMSPLRYDAAVRDACRTCRHLRAIARVRNNFTTAGAAQDLLTVHDGMTSEFPSEYKATRKAVLIPLHDLVVETAYQPLAVILAAAGLLLLATCVNVSTLVLIRAVQKQNELSIRAILGAGSLQLVRQSVLESFCVSIVGGALGIVFAKWLTPALVSLAPPSIPRLDEIALNSSALAAAVVVTLMAGLGVALFPAYQVLRRTAQLDLKPASRWVIGQDSGRTRRALVIGGLACTFALLVAVGLLLKSFDKLMSVDPGFQSTGLVVMNLNSVSPRYPRPEDDIRFFQTVLNSVKAQPGINAVAATSVLPISGNYDGGPFQIEGQAYPVGSIPNADRYVITPEYLSVMGIPVRRGRGFTDRDLADAPRVLMIGETAARKFFPNEDPIGKRVRVNNDWASIVGIVGDVRQYRLDLSPTAEFYLPLAQQARGYMTLVVRSSISVEETIAAVSRGVVQVDSTRALSQISTIDELIAKSEASRRFVLNLLSAYGGLAVFLAVIGIYGTISFTVVSRNREIGIRMALGAQRVQILSLFMRQVLNLALPALTLGTVLVAAGGPLIRNVLFDVKTLDPVIIALAAVGLTGLAILASLAPIRRATNCDPNRSLRDD